ncbi:prolyl oligopeptidase family serine peptidase [Pontibacter sp. G13]|uniref:prolyl oligopeptidase family serine peptidase n=1 Tax=Pontibacter sp. G13 TaxID=3074898 RepID=UPI00288B8450|nr:prolyl oligopeptidase family serine peptidase [Pontibacter sp. G13]WNJ18988.1 prolyl oligopeptidase family serine peptidase [Pontibacter sp. G13]
MKKTSAFWLSCCILAGCSTTQPDNKMNLAPYPETRQDNQVDEYFGHAVADPYRWLEDDQSEETGKWVDAQNEVTYAYLDQLPKLTDIQARLTELMNYERLSAPRREGDFYFFSKNDGLQNQAVIYLKRGASADPEVFIDPNALSEAGTTSIDLLGASKDHTYIAYRRSEAGSDWSEIHVKEIATGKELPDVIKWAKFSDAVWYGNGFFYSRFPEPKEGGELSQANGNQRVFYHELGTDPAEDLLIYEDPERENVYVSVDLSEDESYLILYKRSGTNGFETWFKPTDTQAGGFSPLYTGFEQKNFVIDVVDGQFLVQTDVDAPNYKLVMVDPLNPTPDHWKTFIEEQDQPLERVSTGGGYLFTHYLKQAHTAVFQYDLQGNLLRELELPTLGTGYVGGGKREDEKLFLVFTSFNFPMTIYEVNLTSGETVPYFEPKVAFDPDLFEIKQEFVESTDGKKVSMFIVHRKDLELPGTHPTYLYGYGGFNVNLTPYFSTINMTMLEMGGILAIPNLRGGGEYGESWHREGMLENKQQVFDDFIACAEFLISEGYTSSEKLAIGGGSNGGLLVGACMTQRPELFAVCFPAVGVMDMLRYHKFTVGWGWIPEYGCADSSEQEFEYLYAYSPLHNLKEGTAYPATLVMTADHDDRVVPAHSFKFAATLQAAHQGEAPVLIRIEKNAGHGAGKPISKVIEEYSQQWAFFFYQTKGGMSS